MKNAELRRQAKEKKVKLWELADELQISEATVTRLLRRELPEKEQERLLSVVATIAERKEAEANANAGD